MKELMKAGKGQILLLVIALCCIFGFTGCAASAKRTSDAALSYMKEKYGETFYLIGYEYGESPSDQDMIRMYAEGMDTENEYIAVYPDPDDKTKFSDSYFGYLIRDEMEEEIKAVLGTEECKVYQANVDYAFPDSLNADSTIEDLYEQFPGFISDVNIYLPVAEGKSEQDYQQITENLENWIKEKQRFCYITLFVVNQEFYQAIDRYAQDEFWRYYAEHREADGEKLFYVYSSLEE